MKYPRYNHNEDKRRVLTPEQIEEIISLYDSGMASRKIAAMFEVSKTTILYHCKSGIEKEKINKKRYNLLKLQENRDPSFKQARIEGKREQRKDKLKRSDEMKKYKGKATYKWKKKKYYSDEEFRDKTKKQAREAYARKQKIKNTCTDLD